MLNITLKTDSIDKSNFEEYEETFTYEWIHNLDGIVNDVPNKYVVNGTYDINGRIPILIWGIPSNVNSNHFRGFEITNIICDEKFVSSKELWNVWIPSFINLVLSEISETFVDVYGNNLFDEKGCLFFENTYDYVWCETDWEEFASKSNKILTNKENKHKYYIWKR